MSLPPASDDPYQDPTKVTEARVLLCNGPEYTADDIRSNAYYGRWLIFKNFEDLNQTWCVVRDEVVSGRLGAVGASCSTLWYDPQRNGPGPVTSGRIAVYANEDDYIEVGKKLVALSVVQHDIKFKTLEATKKGEYARSHELNRRIASMIVYWNRGKPFKAGSDEQQPKHVLCPASVRNKYAVRNKHAHYAAADIWKINIVDGLRSDVEHGKWIVQSNYVYESEINITTLWHKLRKQIENGNLPVIKMECPSVSSKESPPEIHVTTSEANMDDVGRKILKIMKCDIKYLTHSNETIFLKWNENLDQSENEGDNQSVEESKRSLDVTKTNPSGENFNEDGTQSFEESHSNKKVVQSNEAPDSATKPNPSEFDDDDLFIRDFEKAVSTDEKISRKLAHAVFVGPTGAGKSSLMDRLLGKRRKGFSPSTGVAEPVVVVSVNLDTSILRSAVVTDGTWEEIDFGNSVVGQIEIKTQLIAESGSSLSLEDHSLHESLSSASLTDTPYHDVGNDTDAGSGFATPVSSPASKVADSFKILREAISGIVSKYGGSKKFKKFLENSFSLYLRDTGGQVEFQEMLPLLVFGPSIFIFVFRLDLDLKKKFEVQYRKSASESLNCYTSSITTEEAFLQFLASVDAMDVSAGVKTHKSFVFVIGTHRDKLGATASESIVQFNESLDSLIKKNGFRDLVQYADRRKGQVMFTVDNISDKEDDFKIIRSKINCLIKGRNEFTIEYPIRYLLFCLELQDMKRSVLTLDECKAMAAKYGIEGDQVLHLLQFLHLRIGVIRYFDKEGVKHIVIREPQFLFNAVTNLIIETFSCEALTDEEGENVEKRGILTASVLATALGDLDCQFTPEDFLQLLVHLRITAPFNEPMSQNKDKKFFIPSILCHVKESLLDEPSATLPLAIKFKCGHCPKGLFGVLVTHLMNPDSDLIRVTGHNVTFMLNKDKIFKNQVSFHVRLPGVTRNEMALKVYSSHLEVKFFSKVILPTSEVCRSVRCIIKELILQSLRDLHYNDSRFMPIMCLRCDCCSELYEVEGTGNEFKMYCEQSRAVKRIPSQGECWYNEDDSGAANSSSTPGPAQAPVLPALKHRTVKKYLTDLTNANLSDLGVNLGLRYVRLKNTSPDVFLDEMVHCWLREDDDVHETSGTPSWGSLVKALKEHRFNGVATKIEKECFQEQK